MLNEKTFGVHLNFNKVGCAVAFGDYRLRSLQV